MRLCPASLALQTIVGSVAICVRNRNCLAQQKDACEITLVVVSRHGQWCDVDRQKVVQIRRLFARKVIEKA